MEYRGSGVSEEKSEKNKINVAKNKYHHNMGPGCYAAAMHKWDAKEKELHDKGIIPEPIHEEWDLRARNCFLGHGSTYDELTGDLVCSEGIKVPRTAWLKVVKHIKDGIK